MGNQDAETPMVPSLTAMRAEIIRDIAADGVFREDSGRSLGSARLRICSRIRTALGGDCTFEEIRDACCCGYKTCAEVGKAAT